MDKLLTIAHNKKHFFRMQTKNKQSLDFEKPLLDLEKQLDDLMQSSMESDLDFSKEIRPLSKR